MTGQQPPDEVADRAVESLDQLSTDELRHRAFSIAEHRLDAKFFWDLLTHLPPAADLASEDASAGNIGGSLAEGVQLVREMFGGDLGAAEPLVRARLISYIVEHG